jgi:hypothetical protein
MEIFAKDFERVYLLNPDQTNFQNLATFQPREPFLQDIKDPLKHETTFTTKKDLFSLKERRMMAVSVLDRLDEISTRILTRGVRP